MDSLSLQDKAKMIIADQAVKLMELQCHKNTTRHQEDREFTKHGAGLPDKKPSDLGGEANTDVAIRLNRETTLNPDDIGAKRDWQGHIRVNDELQYIGKDMQEGGERNKDMWIPLHQTHTRSMGDNYQMEYNHTGKEYNADMGPSYTQVFAQELDNTNRVEYHKENRP